MYKWGKSSIAALIVLGATLSPAFAATHHTPQKTDMNEACQVPQVTWIFPYKPRIFFRQETVEYRSEARICRESA